MATTVLDVVRLSTTFLADRGSESPRLDAELIAAHSLGLRRLDLYLQHDRPLDDAELGPIRELLRRRATGEPVAYLVRSREFYGRRFMVTPAVLVPRPETEILVERVLSWARARAGEAGEGLRIADAGTGSGCIAVTLAAELAGAALVGTDVSAEALAVARDNAAALAPAARVEFLEGGFLTALAGRQRFDAVVSNPPYIPSGELAGLVRDVRDFEPVGALDGGPDGLDADRAIVAGAAGLLQPGGLLALEIDHRAAATVSALIETSIAGARVTVTKDLAGHDRVVEAMVP
jgi:release factor glutamine methyltransferase